MAPNLSITDLCSTGTCSGCTAGHAVGLMKSVDGFSSSLSTNSSLLVVTSIWFQHISTNTSIGLKSIFPKGAIYLIKKNTGTRGCSRNTDFDFVFNNGLQRRHFTFRKEMWIFGGFGKRKLMMADLHRF